MFKKNYQISLFVIGCILVNYIGKCIASNISLPLWLDSLGTVLSAYALGPFSGAVVGAAGNIIYGMQSPNSIIYSLTNIAIGVIAGYAGRKRLFETLFGTLSASVLITLTSIVISTPLNVLFYNGRTGNLWGDGVIGYMLENEMPAWFSYVIGEFYIDFLDKAITLLVLFIIIKLIRRNRRSSHPAESFSYIEDAIASDQAAEPKKKNSPLKKTANMLLLLVVSGSILSLISCIHVSAGDLTNNGETNLNTYTQTVYSNNNGLPCGEANDVVQTTDGILWVGTYAGLYRYNGSEFRWMNEFDSVRNVNCLFVDEEGRLWIGTNDNGLSICINEHISNVVDEKSGLPSNSVRTITKSSNGLYYIGTSDTMQVLTLDNGLQSVATIPEIRYAFDSSADHDEHVAAVNSNGSLLLIKDTRLLQTLELNDAQEVFTSCTFGANGVLYAGTSKNHVYCYDITGDTLQKKNVLNCKRLTNINDIYFTNDNWMFVCADNGLGYFDENFHYHPVNSDSFNNSIDNMTMDYQGNYWFTSSRLGLLRLAESSFVDVYRTMGMESKVVNTIAEWNGHLYFGTDSGLDIVDTVRKKYIGNTLTALLEDVRIRCIKTDSVGRLWICTYGMGLIEVNPDDSYTIYDSKSGTFGNRARVAIELSDGTILAAGDTGLSYIRDDQVAETIHYGDDFCNAMILSLQEMPDGRILCGTDGDGIVIMQNGEMVRRITTDDGLSSGVILRTVENSTNNGVFIVTSNGLCYMDESGSIRVLNNFPYFNNYDVWTVSLGKLFVTGSAGIYVIDEQQLIDGVEEPEYELLDVKKGLNSALTANSWNYRDEDHNLYLACDDGVYVINTDHYDTSKKSYRMMVSSIKQDNVSYVIERGEPFYIERDTAKLEIFPEVINYSLEDPYVSYYLEGFDTAPTVLLQSDLTSIVYTNVPTGSYTFQLSVLDGNTENVVEESSYTLIKSNEIYDLPVFRVYMVIVGMLAVAWFTWFIARTQIQRTLVFQKRQLEFAEEQLRMGNETILAIAKTVDAKDENTSQHSQRVSEYSVLIAREMGFSDTECENLRKAALLHDIGKIGIPDRILNKPGRLTDEEYAVMKTHVTRGAEILKDFTLVDHVVEGALYHHERYDGTGYAQGLSGEDIPLYGRIIGVADAFDAMTANRVYRKKLDFDFVISELKRGRGTQFDPHIVDLFLKLIEDGAIDVEALYNKSIEKS